MGLFVFHAFFGFAQKRYYSNPVKIPMLLSGSFAELRSNHFHSGIDIKTQGTTGLPVYSAANGYISRIVVSPTGFGKALYINHPNGTTTVYAHLEKFSQDIAEYVKDQQYKKESFRVDLPVPSYMFPIKKDQEIGKSGNSGSSGGPHLHFEVRDTKTEEPMNPLQFDFPVSDNIAPKIFSLLVVPLKGNTNIAEIKEARSYSLVFYDGKYHVRNNPTLSLDSNVGFAIQTNDYFNDSYNKCGINYLQMSIDGKTHFAFQLNRFAFHNSRYINSHIAFDEYKISNRKFIRTWLEPANKLPIYNHNGSEGVFSPLVGQSSHVEIEIQDTYRNTSILSFNVKGVEPNRNHKHVEEGVLFKMTNNNTLYNDSLKVAIPGKALYNDFYFEYKTEQASNDFFSKYHFIHNKTVPLHSNATISLKADNLPQHLESKALLVNVDPMTGEYYAAGGEFKDGWLETKTRTLGVYAITVDTIPPEIIPRSIENNTLKEPDRIRFTIKDDLAGIKSIEGILDGKWALFDYDPKNSRITHYFDKDRFEFNKQHSLELRVTDYRDNSTVYEAGFWK